MDDTTTPRREHGFTLIELLITVSLLLVVGVVILQTLDSVTR